MDKQFETVIMATDQPVNRQPKLVKANKYLSLR